MAAYALLAYVGGIEDEANDNAERVEIFKIVQDIPKGTFGDEAFAQGFIEEDVIAKEYRPATAITEVADRGPRGDLRPAGQPGRGEQPVRVRRRSPSPTFSSLLKNNEVAITVSVDQVAAWPGLLVPGDFVDMVVVEACAARAAPGGSTRVFKTRHPLPVPEGADPRRGPDPKLEPGRRRPPTPTAPGRIGDLRPHHLRGARRRRPADRLRRRAERLPDPRRQGLPARARLGRWTRRWLPARTAPIAHPYGPDGRPSSRRGSPSTNAPSTPC